MPQRWALPMPILPGGCIAVTCASAAASRSSTSPVPSGGASSTNKISVSKASSRTCLCNSSTFSRSLKVGTKTRGRISSAADDFDFRQRGQHLAAGFQICLLARQYAFLEVPGQNQEVVGIDGARLGFGNDGDIRPGREAAEFVRIDLGDGADIPIVSE